MMSQKMGIARFLAVVVMLSMLMMAPAQAFTVFDPTNFVQSIKHTLETIRSVSNQVKQLQEAINQGKEMVRQGKALAGGFAALNPLAKVQQLGKFVDASSKLVTGLEEADRLVKDVSDGFGSSNVDFKTFLKLRKTADAGRFQKHLNLLKQVGEGIKAANDTRQEAMAALNGADGPLAAAQASGVILDGMSGQIQTLTQLMAATEVAKVDEQKGRVADEAAALNFLRARDQKMRDEAARLEGDGQ